MSLPIFAIRPEPGCSATVAAGTSTGLEVRPCPVFEVRPTPWSGPPRADVDAILLGSANAIRHGGTALTAYRGLPAFAVGQATADAAEVAGLAIAAKGQGGLQTVLDGLQGTKMRLLRLAGAERIELIPPEGVTIETRTAYETVALPLPAWLAAELQTGGLVLLHSASAARHLAAECDRCGVDRGNVALAALGPRIAESAGYGWRAVRSALLPTDAALLALALEMCHDLP